MKNKLVLIMMGFLIILLLGSSYALLKDMQFGNDYKLQVGNLEVIFSNQESDELKLFNLTPMSDKDGLNQSEKVLLTVRNKGENSKYNIYIEPLDTDLELKNYLHFATNKNNEGFKEIKTLSQNNYVDLEANLDKEKTENIYEIKIWLDEFTDISYTNKSFKGKLIVEEINDDNNFS